MKPNTKHLISIIITLFTFTFYLFSFLSADTIIDSVYSDPLLDGYIYYSQNAQAFSVNNWMYDMGAGDTHGPIPFPDQKSRPDPGW